MNTNTILNSLALLLVVVKPDGLGYSYRDFDLWNEGSNCGNGNQSPIDFVNEKVSAPMDIAKQSFGLGRRISPNLIMDVHHNGVDVLIDDFDHASHFEFQGTVYKLKDIHLHFGSEHLIEGIQGDMEAHFFHQSDDGKNAVIGIVMKTEDEAIGRINPYPGVLDLVCPQECHDGLIFNSPTFFKNWWGTSDLICEDFSVVDHDARDMITIRDESIYSVFGLDISILEKELFMHYTGSTTTPPCSADVEWFVFKKIVPVYSNINMLDVMNCRIYKEMVHRSDGGEGNYRPVQAYDTFNFTMFSDTTDPKCKPPPMQIA